MYPPGGIWQQLKHFSVNLLGVAGCFQHLLGKKPEMLLPVTSGVQGSLSVKDIPVPNVNSLNAEKPYHQLMAKCSFRLG